MSALTKTEIKVRKVAAEDWLLVAQMYEEFKFSAENLGLPPRDAGRRTQWLEKFRKEGINLAVWADDLIVGHSVLMPSEVVAEMALFVREDYRREGLAWALAKAAIEEGRKRGLRSIWVLISSSNVAAWQGLQKFGFRTAWESGGEVQLVYHL